MRLSPVVDQLKQAGLKRVYGALELAGLEKAPGQLPAYFVVPEGEDAAPNTLVGAHDQAAGFRFGVVIIFDGAARNDERVSEQISEQSDRVIHALIGWTHPDASRACDYAGARMLTLSASGRTLAWMASFRTARHIRKVTP